MHGTDSLPRSLSLSHTHTPLSLPLFATLAARSSRGDGRFGTLGRRGFRGFLVALEFLILLFIFLLGIPLAGLQDQDADQDQGQDGIARGEHLQAVLAAEDLIGFVGSVSGQVGAVLAATHEAETLDDVGDVDGHAAHVEDQTGAVEQHVRLRRLVQLGDHAGEPQEDDDVQDARDQGRRRVQEPQVRFQVVEMRRRRRLARPEKRIVIGEEREDDAEEETGRYTIIIRLAQHTHQHRADERRRDLPRAQTPTLDTEKKREVVSRKGI